MTIVSVLLYIAALSLGFAIGALAVHAWPWVDMQAGAVYDRLIGYKRD